MGDPYPALARLRAEAPVWFSEQYDAWIVTSAEACERVLRDPETFPSGPVAGPGAERLPPEGRG